MEDKVCSKFHCLVVITTWLMTWSNLHFFFEEIFVLGWEGRGGEGRGGEGRGRSRGGRYGLAEKY
jgi:hypothetical protein